MLHRKVTVREESGTTTAWAGIAWDGDGVGWDARDGNGVGWAETATAWSGLGDESLREMRAGR